MKLIDCKNWKAVHFDERTILRSDKNLFPKSVWNELLNCTEVEEVSGNPAHYRVIDKRI